MPLIFTSLPTRQYMFDNKTVLLCRLSQRKFSSPYSTKNNRNASRNLSHEAFLFTKFFLHRCYSCNLYEVNGSHEPVMPDPVPPAPIPSPYNYFVCGYLPIHNNYGVFGLDNPAYRNRHCWSGGLQRLVSVPRIYLAV